MAKDDGRPLPISGGLPMEKREALADAGFRESAQMAMMQGRWADPPHDHLLRFSQVFILTESEARSMNAEVWEFISGDSADMALAVVQKALAEKDAA